MGHDLREGRVMTTAGEVDGTAAAGLRTADQVARPLVASTVMAQARGDSAEAATHARLAQDCAQESIELARHTENRRQLAEAHVWQGLTLSNHFFADLEGARHCYDQATALLKTDQLDSAWEDLQSLKNRLLRSGSVNPVLRAWSQGAVGDKTFQQITEEFAELIIPKVWEREGRKISRVASRLSMSPKKVRRILSRAGSRKGRK